MSAMKVLVTGASGYIGGAFIEALLENPLPNLPLSSVHALVRSEAAAKKLKEIGINSIIASLEEAEKVKKAIAELEIDVIVDTADAFHPQPSVTLLEALEQVKASSGKKVHFIHTSGTSSLSDKSGWKWPAVRDTEDIYTLHKQVELEYGIRTTDVKVSEVADAKGIPSYIAVVPTVYGRNHNNFSNQYSIQWPTIIRTAIRTGKVNNTASPDAIWPLVHIKDLGNFYRLLVLAIISGQTPPSGKNNGFYFAVAHNYRWSDITAGLAKELYKRGLITSPEPEPWSLEEAARSLGTSKTLAEFGFGSNDDIVPEKARKQLGWIPNYTEEYMMSHLSDEVEDVLQAGKD